MKQKPKAVKAWVVIDAIGVIVLETCREHKVYSINTFENQADRPWQDSLKDGCQCIQITLKP